jgi:hypothetical protein
VSHVYLTSSSRNDNPPFAWSAKDHATNSITVVSSENSAPGFLRKALGGDIIVKRVTFKSTDGNYYDLLYHPGPLLDTAEAAWDLVGSGLKFIAAHRAIQQHRAESDQPIPGHVWSAAADNGVSGSSTLHQCFNHITSAVHYPHEGYYFARGEEPGVFIKGKIYPIYLLA